MTTRRRQPNARLVHEGKRTDEVVQSRVGERTASGTLPRLRTPAAAQAEPLVRGAGAEQVPDPAEVWDSEPALRERSHSLPEADGPAQESARLASERSFEAAHKQSGMIPIVGRQASARRRARARSAESDERSERHSRQPRPQHNASTASSTEVEMALHWGPAAEEAPRAPPRVLESLVSQRRAFALAAIGFSLCALFASQALMSVEWPWLSSWQRQDVYKLWTGAALALFVTAQWLLAIARINGQSRLARSLYTWHQRSGVLAPLVLFAHSTKFGFGYLSVLSALFLGNTLLGLMSPRAFPKLRRYAGVWLSGHIALSIALVMLVVYHAWIAVYFE